MKVYVVWECEQRRGYDREEALSPFYLSEEKAEEVARAIGAGNCWREVREYEVVE